MPEEREIQTPNPEDGAIPTLTDGTEETPQAEPSAPSDPRPPGEDYKSKFAASTRENQRLQEELRRMQEQQRQDEEQRQLEQYAMQQRLQQLQQPQQPQQEAPPAPTPSAGLQVLSPEERSEYRKALEDFDYDKQFHFQSLMAERIADQRSEAKTRQLLQSMGSYSQLAQTQQAVTQELAAAEELKDQSAYRKILLKTIQMQQNPVISGQFAQAAVNIPNVGAINPYIMRAALMEHRSETGTVKKAAQAKANASAYVDMGVGSGPDTSSPDTTGTFNASVHLSEAERSALQLDAASKGSNDFAAAYKKHWNRLTEADRQARLKAGRPVGTAMDTPAKTLWRANKKW